MNKKNINLIIASILILLFVGCDMWNKNHFITKGFGVDLSAIAELKETKYEDGILEVKNISVNDEIYKKFINEKFIECKGFYHFGNKNKVFKSYNKKDTALYKKYGMADDSHYKIIVYIPKEKLLIFMYAEDIGG